MVTPCLPPHTSSHHTAIHFSSRVVYSHPAVFCLQLNLNNRPLSQMLKSTGTAEDPEEDPLEYYENHTAQIEVSLKLYRCYIARIASLQKWATEEKTKMCPS